MAKLAAQKRWGPGDWLRSLPVLDGFASPIKIHQITLDELPIDYSFKYVTRFDRCMSCHTGIDRPAFARENLKALRQVPSSVQTKLRYARRRLWERKKELEGTDDIPYMRPQYEKLAALIPQLTGRGDGAARLEALLKAANADESGAALEKAIAQLTSDASGGLASAHSRASGNPES